MKNGVYAQARAIFDHPMFKDEPFTEREAWSWMCGAAAFKAMTVRVAGQMIDLERGQLAFSQRFLQERFQWSRQRVRGFIAKLELHESITQIPTKGVTKITLCNYDKWAFGQPDEQPQSNQAVTRQRPKEEELKELKETTSSEKEEDFRDTPIESPLKATSIYAFEGKVVKLTQRDFDRWKRAYSALDLNAELIARDAYLASDKASDTDRKNWFPSTAQHLANRNQKAKAAQQPNQVKWRSGIEGVY